MEPYHCYDIEDHSLLLDDKIGVPEEYWQHLTKEENMKLFVKMYEDCLRYQRAGKCVLDGSPREVPQNLSSWWINPKVTLMTVREFGARYS